MPYIARYTQGTTTSTTDMRLDAITDEQAMAELRKIVESGYRNETHASVELSDGRLYGARNEHGTAKGGFVA